MNISVPTRRRITGAVAMCLSLSLVACGSGASARSGTSATTPSAPGSLAAGSATTQSSNAAARHGDIKAWCAAYRSSDNAGDPAGIAAAARDAVAAAPADIASATATWSGWLNGATNIDPQRYADATAAVMKYFGAHC